MSTAWPAAVCLAGKDQPQDLEQAFTLFQQEAQKGNALAMHDLGRMLADGLGRKIDMQAAHVWYSKALAAFYAVERQKKKRYAEYRIGKLYAAGLGCEQDYGDAAGGSNFPQTKGTSMRNIPLPACFAVDRVWNRTMRGRWSYTQPPHSRTSPMPPTS